MTERITRQNVDDRCRNLNRRMIELGARVGYIAEGRNGYIGLDRYEVIEQNSGYTYGACLSNVVCGTKREIADFLHAMMVALDDAKLYAGEEGRS